MAIARDQCSQPPPLSEQDLFAALDGMADPATEAHLAACQFCRRRLASARRFVAALSGELLRQGCPSVDALSELVWGTLDRQAAAEISRHVGACLRCAEELAYLREGVQPPAKTPSPSEERAPGRARRWIERVAASLAPPREGLVLRGADQRRRLEARTDREQVLVEIEVDADHDRATVTGQILTEDDGIWEGALVELYQGAQLRSTAFVDEMSEFSLPGASALPIRLVLSSGAGRQIAAAEPGAEPGATR